jgi:hypothetical protein
VLVGPKASSLTGWSPEQIALGKLWVAAWKKAGPELAALRRSELRKLDTYSTIAMLCGPADYSVSPRAPKPISGLVEQQAWFQKYRQP